MSGPATENKLGTLHNDEITVVKDSDGRPQRTQTYALAAMLGLCNLTLYTMRANVSFALDGKHGMSHTYGWDDKGRGLVQSGFFWGYIVSQLPGGWLTTKFGGRKVLLWTVICCSVLSVRDGGIFVELRFHGSCIQHSDDDAFRMLMCVLLFPQALTPVISSLGVLPTTVVRTMLGVSAGSLYPSIM